MLIMNLINPKIAARQAKICIALVRELDRAVTESNQPADQYLANFYRRHREYGSRDRRFLSDAAFSWFRWRGWLKTPENENIAAAILLDAGEVPPQLEYFGLEPGLRQMPRAERPAHRDTVEGGCRAQRDIPRTSKFPDFQSSNADLKPAGRLTLEEKAAHARNLLKIHSPRQNSYIPSKTAAGLAEADLPAEADSAQAGPGSPTPATIALVPGWLPDFIFIPEKTDRELHLRQCIQAFQSRPPAWLRLPSGEGEHFLSLLHKAGIEVEAHPLLKQAVFVKGRGGFDSARFPRIQLQDLASQCVGICCAPGPGENWWDVCAGAGGKSLHLADLMRDKGSIAATDIRPEILDQLSTRLRQNNYRSIRPFHWDGEGDPWPEKQFDGVLVDAPCSGLGTWHRNPDARWRTYPEQIPDYARTQANLLRLAAGKVKPNGRLVYSTCTLTKAENADVIQVFLETHRDFHLEKLINPLNREPASGLIWVWPWEWNSNGMFIAVMKKVD